MNVHDDTFDNDLQVHERPPSRPLMDWVPPLLVGTQTLTLALGLPNIITGSGGFHNLKIASLTLGAGIVSFGVMHLAVSFGAPYAAKRFRLAAIASIVGIMFVGAGFALATFSGNILPDVAALRMQDHGTKLAQEISQVNQVATEASRSGATLGVIASDLHGWAACEQSQSCLSKAAATGRGSITVVLEGLAEQAEAIQQQYEQGEAAREHALEEINDHFADYQRIVGQTEISIWERRNTLKQTDNLLHQATAKLSNAVPLHLIERYAEELSNGIKLSGRADVAQRINAILSEHGKNLEAILESSGGTAVMRPIFPARPGVGEAVTHAMDFLPLFLLIIAIDGVLPISVWIMAYLKEVWIIEQALKQQKYKSQNTAKNSGSGNATPPQAYKNGKTTPLDGDALE